MGFITSFCMVFVYQRISFLEFTDFFLIYLNYGNVFFSFKCEILLARQKPPPADTKMTDSQLEDIKPTKNVCSKMFWLLKIEKLRKNKKTTTSKQASKMWNVIACCSHWMKPYLYAVICPEKGIDCGFYAIVIQSD